MRKSVAILLLFTILLVGCKPTGNIDSFDTVSFTDALGREVSVKKDPSRVAALLGSFADVWILAGGELCAAPSDASEDFGIDMSEMVSLGGAHSPSLELLLSASPDLVIASASTASNVKMKDTLESAGITVAYFDVDNFDDYLYMLKICTDITGRADLYEQNGTNIKLKIEQIKSGFDLPEEKRTVLLLRAASTFVKAKGSQGTILGEMLADLGCINIADSDSSLLESLSIESIIKNQPYHILAVTMGSDTDAAKASLSAMIGENPALSSLSAIQEGRFYVMDKTLFNLKPNDHWAEAYETLAKTLVEEKQN